ncbi:MAG: ABC transporter substrate-binding protein [Candidatus Bathyarchaeota archaeon]|nr:ABC transporter substrate-binding protein [Candidatus Bathyarchaeota archaeon]
MLSDHVLANKTVKIGYIAIKTVRYNSEDVFIKKIVEPDLNEYATKLGYGLRFEFVVELVEDDWALNRRFIELKSEGVNLVIPGNGNLGVDITLSYAANNGMVLVSPTSNQTDFAEGQRTRLPLFRLCPVKGFTGSSLADLMWNYGIRTAAILQPASSWGDEISNDFEAAWKSYGGVLVDAPVRFESTADYSDYLRQLDSQVARALQSKDGAQDTVGVLGLCRSEASVVAMQAANYPHLFNVTWFGANFTASNTLLASLAGPRVEHLRWISLKPEAPNSDSYNNLSARYLALTGKQIDIFSTYLYDSAFLLARSVVEAQSDDGIKVEGVFQEVSNSTFGVSGWCGLNVNRDRIPPRFEIWTFTSTASNSTTRILVGTLDPVSHKVTLYNSLG